MNNLSNTAVSLSPEAVSWCGEYSGLAFDLAWWFLYLALLVALIETALVLWTKIRAAWEGPPAAQPANAKSMFAAGVDPVKLLEALKGVLETLKGLPVWIAIFLAGAALLWFAGQRPEICTPKPQAERQQVVDSKLGKSAADRAKASGQTGANTTPPQDKSNR